MEDRTRSPFPGMDPYLEAYWPDVHNKLIAFAAGALNAVLPDDLVARAELQIDLRPDNGGGDTRPAFAVPDVRVEPLMAGDFGEGGGTAVLAPPAPGVAAATATALLPMRRTGPRQRRWIKVSEIDGGRPVTSIEFLSPANKLGVGRRDFLRKRRRLLARRVNCVEIDLTRSGDPHRLVPPGFSLPPKGRRAAYRAMIFTPAAGDLKAWVHPMPLEVPLPPVAIPLRRGESPVELALQPLIDQAYREGRYAGSLRYDEPPDPPFSADDAAWAAGLVEAAAVA